MQIKSIFFIFLLTSASSQSFACVNPINFGQEQALALIDEIKTADSTDYDLMLNYEKLLCSDQQIVRNIAQEVGLNSSLMPIRSAAIKSSLFEKNLIVITVFSKDGMNKEEVEFIKKYPILSYHIEFRDDEHNCISLSNPRKCTSNALLSLSGNEVALNYKQINAKFRLEQDGVLRGVLNIPKSQVFLPVELLLD